MRSPRISVCIPTCDRPEYLKEALHSALDQDLTPREILIGDNSEGEKTKELIRQYQDAGPVRYTKNDPPVGQAGNVDQLFGAAQGEYIVLLHDDDLLLEGALRTLYTCFEQNEGIVAAFGKQQLADATGTVLKGPTQTLNEEYHRTEDNAGRQPSSLRSAITQQFPNDGFMVDAAVAKQVGYDNPQAGDACDFAFGVALAQASGDDFYFVDTYTAQYRESEESIRRGEGASDTAYNAFRIVTEELPGHVRSDPVVKEWLERRAPAAIVQAAQNDDALKGLKWFFGPHHQDRVSLGGARRFFALLAAFLRSGWKEADNANPGLKTTPLQS